MSTTASSVYESNETYKKQVNFYMRSSTTVDRKAVGGPVDNVPSRKCSNTSSTVLPPQFLRMNSAHPSSSSSMISLGTSTNLKFDRSLSEPSGDTRLASSQNQLSHINSNKYKTELCRSYDESRQCKYGEKCRYAHGSTELRTPARHPKYKTEPCRTYHSSGFCPYGPRCHFIHNEYERKSTQSSNSGSANSGNGPTNINQNTVVKENVLQNGHGTSSNSSLSPTHPLFQNVICQNNSFVNNNNNNGGNMNFGMLPKSGNFNSISSSSLGSTADSPPSSVTDSPTPSVSPLFFADDFQGSNNAYTLSSSPSSSSSMPLSASSSSTSISGIALEGIFSCTTAGLTNPFDLLTISEWEHDLSTNQSEITEHFLQEELLLEKSPNLIQNSSFFPDETFDTSKLPYEWSFGGFPDYGRFENY